MPRGRAGGGRRSAAQSTRSLRQLVGHASRRTTRAPSSQTSAIHARTSGSDIASSSEIPISPKVALFRLMSNLCHLSRSDTSRPHADAERTVGRVHHLARQQSLGPDHHHYATYTPGVTDRHL